MNAEFIASELGRFTRKAGGGFMACCPAHADKNPSLAIDDDNGKVLVKCFAGCEQDAVIDVLKSRGLWPGDNNTSTTPRKASTAEIWTPIAPVPTDAPAPPADHFRHGKPSMVSIYLSADGDLLQLIYRFDLGDKNKEFFPLTYCTNGTRREWRFKTLPEPRPLYGLETIDTANEVLLVEGEKTADAARRLTGSKLPVLTWPGGSGAVGKADFSPLAGKTVAFWPDADKPGMKAALALCDELERIGCTVKVVEPPADAVEKWDLADAESEGWTREQVLDFLKRSIPAAEYRAKDQSEAATPPELKPLVEPTGTVKLKWPESLSPEAMPGLIKTFVDTATENSEADPAAVLATLLVKFAITCGNTAFFHVGDNKHYARLNAAIVGETAIGRKGTSAGPVNSVFELLTDSCRTTPGPLSTGEGITYAVRDEVQEWKIDKKSNTGEWVIIDPGVTDKRLTVIEEEFASALQATKRDGNTLSAIVRTLWDSGNCEPLTKSNRIKCTGAHVGIVAHITLFELQKLLSENEKLNGFGNRFLWVCSRRPKLVAFPEPMPEQFKKQMAAHIESAIIRARAGGEYVLSAKAKELWSDLYPDLAEGRTGIAGAMIGRAAPYVLRLAFTYCLFREGSEIDTEDLEAALSFWRYADQSASFIFGGTVAPDRNKQKILKCIGNAKKSKTEIRREAFANHITADRLSELLTSLERDQVIFAEPVQKIGPPRTIYRKNPKFSGVLSALSFLSPATDTDRGLSKHKTHSDIETIDDSVFAGVVNDC